MQHKSFSGKLVENRRIADDVVLLSFDVPTFSFQAGQYVMIKVRNGSESKWRMYSVANPPSRKGIDLCIKIVEGGFATPALEKAKPGSVFEFKGPLGEFLFDPDAQENWFVATGTGISPMYSMIMENLPKSRAKFVLISGFRYKKNLLFHEEFSMLAKKYKNFLYYPTLSREPSWRGCKGHVQDVLKQLSPSPAGKTFYVCGLKEMVTEVVPLLGKMKVPKARIRFERYS